MPIQNRLLVAALSLLLVATAPLHAGSDGQNRSSGGNVINVSGQADVRVISNDRGGSIVSYAQDVSRMRTQDTFLVFNGQCASACTLYLGLGSQRTCIAPGASFVFHRAYGASADMNQWGTDYMIRQYPDWVRSWIARNGGLTNRLIRMDYEYASRFMRPCRVRSA